MRIAGRRADGALYLSMGSGLAVILKGPRVTPTLDESVIETMGPWTPADNSFDRRRSVQRVLDLARVASLDHFVSLGMSFDEQRERVTAALRVRMGMPAQPYGLNQMDLWIPQNGLGEDWIVYSQSGKYYGMVYDVDNGGTVTFTGNPVEVRSTWESLEDTGEDDAPTFDDAIQLRQTEWFKRFKASKKKEMAAPTVGPSNTGASGTTVATPSLQDDGTEDIKVHEPEEAVPWEVHPEPVMPPKKKKKPKHPLPHTLADNSLKFSQLLESTEHAKHLADKSEHPFTWCMEHVIPAMEKEGKGPDDPEAFCAWYKQEGPGSE